MIPWPHVADVRDPFPEPLAPRDQRFRAMIGELFVSREHLRVVERAARCRGLDRPLLPHTVPLPVVPELASEATLVRLAADFDPACGSSGLDLVLGPLVDEPQAVRTLQVAMALSAFFPGDDVLGPPYRRWQRSTPAPSVIDRAAVRAIALAPLAPWRVTSIEGEEVELHDMIGLAPLVRPVGRVRLRPPGTPFGPLRPGMVLLARVAPEQHGDAVRWVATCPLAVPGPLPPRVQDWLRWLAWELRLTFRGPVTRAVLLARRGHIVARHILESAWARS